MKKKITDSILAVVQKIYGRETVVILERPEEKFGDFTTNVAMQLAGELKQNPKEIADNIAKKLRENEDFIEVTVDGPGFINIRVADKVLLNGLGAESEKSWQDKVVVCEYSDPNPFKVLHAGHLYTTLVGDVIGNLFEIAGADLKRVNFGGDVGLHVARAMWAIMQTIGAQDVELFLSSIAETARPEWVSARYVEGNTAYENDEAAKFEIIELNKKIYELHTSNEKESQLSKAYWTCRQWSYDGFEILYENLGVKKFDKYYPESATTQIGIRAAKEALKKGVLEESDGAVVFKGERVGLHTRVFLNSNGLPTYETKDLGLAITKWQDYHFDKSIMITANDIVEYMKVVQEVIKTFSPEIFERSEHITHGIVKLAGGQKMSSRKGNVLLAQEVINAAREANKLATGKEDENVVLGAIKYAFLKNRVGGDVIYDPAESVSLVGNSGPYLQYAHARANSILRKSEIQSVGQRTNFETSLILEPGERSLVRKLTEYTEVVNRAVDELAPHHVCSYIFELAQAFNRFYETNKVIGGDREELRLTLVSQYAEILKNGLNILGIKAPESM